MLLHLAWYVEPGRYWTAPENVHWVEARWRCCGRSPKPGVGGPSSPARLPSTTGDAVGERCHEQRTPLRPATLYGAAKHALHCVAARYAEQAGFELAWGRIFFVYGPGEPEGRLVPSVGRALLAGEPVPTTRGDQVRDFMHVEDAAAAFAALADSERDGGGEHRLRGARDGARGGGPPRRDWPAGLTCLGPGALPDREGDPPRLVADVTRLRDEVGFAPRIGLPEGLAGTLEWLRAAERVG